MEGWVNVRAQSLDFDRGMLRRPSVFSLRIFRVIFLTKIPPKYRTWFTKAVFCLSVCNVNLRLSSFVRERFRWPESFFASLIFMFMTPTI